MYGRDVSLVEKMRMREKTLMKKMMDRQRQRVTDHERKIRQSWQSRKERQEKLLQVNVNQCLI